MADQCFYLMLPFALSLNSQKLMQRNRVSLCLPYGNCKFLLYCYFLCNPCLIKVHSFLVNNLSSIVCLIAQNKDHVIAATICLWSYPIQICEWSWYNLKAYTHTPMVGPFIKKAYFPIQSKEKGPSQGPHKECFTLSHGQLTLVIGLICYQREHETTNTESRHTMPHYIKSGSHDGISHLYTLLTQISLNCIFKDTLKGPYNHSSPTYLGFCQTLFR